MATLDGLGCRFGDLVVPLLPWAQLHSGAQGAAVHNEPGTPLPRNIGLNS
jgi:hypothetical protein